MRWKYVAILFITALQVASCSKDKLNPEGSIKIYNNFLDFNNTTKIEGGGYYALVSDYIYTDRFSIIKIDKYGSKEWQKNLDRTGSFDTKATQYKYLNVKEAHGGGCIVFATIKKPNGSTSVGFKKISGNGTENPWSILPMYVHSGDVSKLDGATIDSVVFKRMATNWDNTITTVAYVRHNNNHSIMLNRYSISQDGIVDTIPGIQPHEYYISKYKTAGGPTTMNIIATSEGGYLVTASPNGMDHKGFFLKVDANLNELWRSYYLTTEDVIDFNAAIEGGNGNYLVFGKAGHFADGKTQEDFYLFSLNSSHGDKQWERRYADTAKLANIPRNITALPTGEFLLVGEQSNYNPNGDVQTHVPGTFIYVQKIRPNGDPTTLYEYSSSFGLHANDVEQMDDGGFHIIGSKHSFGNEAFRDMFIFKTLPSGNFNDK